MSTNHGGGGRAWRCGLGLVIALVASGPLRAADYSAADEWQEIVARSQAADDRRMGRVAAPAAAPAPARRRPAAKTPGAHGVTAHTRDARPVLVAPDGQTAETGARAEAMQKARSGSTVAGRTITIISGGGSSDGATRVGRLPITQ